jgi:[acyl-carrier-protein] S-malonyltransferase
MQSFAFVFPGQGSQSVGMGRALSDASPAAAAVFAEADAALGEPISRLAWDGPAEELDRTENAQPALLAASIAYLAALRERWTALGVEAGEPAFAAGHSMGQYSALVAAGVVSIADGMRLVRERGRLMQTSGEGRDGAMAAVIGLDPAAVETLCADAGVAVANLNTPTQTVVSGSAAGIERLRELAAAAGARAVQLPVGGAFHSPAMEPVRAAMAEAAAAVTWRPAEVPIAANASGALVTSATEVRAALVAQITAPVRWVACVRTLAAAGCTGTLELGPGRVLSGLVRAIDGGLETAAADSQAHMIALQRAAEPVALRSGALDSSCDAGERQLRLGGEAARPALEKSPMATVLP